MRKANVGGPAASPDEAWVTWLPTEGLLGAAQNLADWEQRPDTAFAGGMTYLAIHEHVRAKWNFNGTSFRLRLPKGPGLGAAEILLDGVPLATLDLSAETFGPTASFTAPTPFPDGPHAVVVRPSTAASP